MTVFYLDTSALVKRYKTEEGTEIIDYLYDNLPKGHSLATSFLTVLEFVSAIRRLLKGNRISQDDFEAVMSTFSQELEPFLIRSLEDNIVADALNKVVSHALKSADSIQLSTALELREMMKEAGENVIFICDDAELLKAGRREELDVISPRSEVDKLKLKELLS
jgi:predicted nucleic acid-binding protein